MYIYGKNVVKEALKNKQKIKQAFIYADFNDREILNLLNNINTKFLDKRGLDRITKENHQGIILEVDDFEYNDEQELPKCEFLIILDHIQDPHNFGAIIRTCEAAGVDGIIIPKDRSVEVNSTVIKVSTGAIENMKIFRITNLVNTINMLKKNGFWIIGTAMDGTPYSEIDYKGKIAIVIGNEGDGMSRLTRESCDFVASIPMIGKTNSLNASVASGIIIYEALKNRK